MLHYFIVMLCFFIGQVHCSYSHVMLCHMWNTIFYNHCMLCFRWSTLVYRHLMFWCRSIALFGHWHFLCSSQPMIVYVMLCGMGGCYAIWYDMMWYDMMWCDVMWCDVMWCDMMWCDVMWCDVMWCDVIWYDMMWCVMMLIWCDISEWCRMIRHSSWQLMRTIRQLWRLYSQLAPRLPSRIGRL